MRMDELKDFVNSYRKEISFALVIICVSLIIIAIANALFANKPRIFDMLSTGKGHQVEKQYHVVEYYSIDKKRIENSIIHFIKAYFGNSDPNYVRTVATAYTKLIDEERDNKHNVLYYVALCSVESNFRMSARSGAGAVGISQVMPSVWAKTIEKNYGITKEELYIDVYKNIYAGYRIWDNYRRKGDGSIKAANAGYLGTSSNAYESKINSRYVELMELILDGVFDDIETSTIEVKIDDNTKYKQEN